MQQGAPLDAFADQLVAPHAAANEATDEALMVAYCEGQAPALEALYDRYADSLYRFFMRCTHQHAALSEDFIQDVFVSLVKCRNTYQPRAAFRHFIFRLAHNRVVSHWRSARPTANLDDTEHLLPSADSDPEHEVVDDDLATRVAAGIDALPEDQRLVVTLRLDAELSYEQIAEIQGVGMETSKNRYRLAVTKLRRVLTDD